MVVVEVLRGGKKSSPTLKVEPRKYCWKIGSHKEEKESVPGDSNIWPELSERWNNHGLIWGDFGTCSHEAKIRIHFWKWWIWDAIDIWIDVEFEMKMVKRYWVLA